LRLPSRRIRSEGRSGARECFDTWPKRHDAESRPAPTLAHSGRFAPDFGQLGRPADHDRLVLTVARPTIRRMDSFSALEREAHAAMSAAGSGSIVVGPPGAPVTLFSTLPGSEMGLFPGENATVSNPSHPPVHQYTLVSPRIPRALRSPRVSFTGPYGAIRACTVPDSAPRLHRGCQDARAPPRARWDEHLFYPIGKRPRGCHGWLLQQCFSWAVVHLISGAAGGREGQLAQPAGLLTRPEEVTIANSVN
jgi:hypothetical protein